MAIYAIGDVQGCYTQLQNLLKEIKFKADKDQLWFAGDIINRGPDSLTTIRFIKALGDNAITVLGNHDLHLLAVANGRGKQGRKDTIKDILTASDREQLLDWLIYRPLMHYDEKRDEYAHPAVVFVLTEEGIISRYLFGINYQEKDLRFALMEASAGNIGDVFDKFLLYCFHYDPDEKAYVLFAGNVMKIGGVLTVLFLGIVLVTLWRRESNRNVAVIKN